MRVCAPRSGRASLFIIAAAVAAAYANSFRGAFVFDDLQSIVDNTSIRHLSTAWAPPGDGTTVTGRPLLNLTFALNYVLTGPGVAGFHAGNLLIHAAAALTLFGLLRRTPGGEPLALVATILWAVHPLQTESVTYLAQRAESLMGLFYLFTLYAWARGWRAVSVLACFLGMATKEVMVTAPVMVGLYDWVFCRDRPNTGRSKRSAAFWYGALGLSWGLLAGLVAGTGGNRNGSIGFGIAVPWWKYALTEFHVIVRYLRLSVFPSPLVFYYNAEWARNAWDVIPGLAVVLILIAVTARGIARRQPLGFLGAWFLLILAPTSSIVPGATQTCAEHRMYLPLAAIAVAAAWAGSRVRWRLNPVWMLLPVLVWLTALRNQTYASELTLWRDTVDKSPNNELALHNLGNALLKSGEPEAATARYREALALRPDDAKAHHNLGYVLLQGNRVPEAVREFQAALRINPDLPEARLNLGTAFLMAEQPQLALPEMTRALALTPADPKVHYNLALVLFALGRDREGVEHLQDAVRLDPGYRPAREALERVRR
jgi:tetratricopeptide (TPR) repeat protein